MGAIAANLTDDGWITVRIRLGWWSRSELINALATDFYQSKSELERYEHPEIQDMQFDFEDKLESLSDVELADACWKMAQRTNTVEDDGDIWIDRYGLVQVQTNGYPEEGNSGL